ncbi:MAG: thioesterase family protein [Tetrasphaera sp.]
MQPSLGQIRELPCQVPPFTVPPEFEDANGHVNIRHYLDLGSRAVTALFVEFGITDEYRRDRRLGFFTAENHLAYFGELLAGQEAEAHAHVVGRSARAVHSMAYVVDLSTGSLAATFESLAVHVGMDTRRPAPMPLDIAERVDRVIARGRTSWQPPTGKVIRLRDAVIG